MDEEKINDKGALVPSGKHELAKTSNSLIKRGLDLVRCERKISTNIKELHETIIAYPQYNPKFENGPTFIDWRNNLPEFDFDKVFISFFREYLIDQDIFYSSTYPLNSKSSYSFFPTPIQPLIKFMEELFPDDFRDSYTYVIDWKSKNREILNITPNDLSFAHFLHGLEVFLVWHNTKSDEPFGINSRLANYDTFVEGFLYDPGLCARACVTDLTINVQNFGGDYESYLLRFAISCLTQRSRFIQAVQCLDFLLEYQKFDYQRNEGDIINLKALVFRAVAAALGNDEYGVRSNLEYAKVLNPYWGNYLIKEYLTSLLQTANNAPT